MTVRPMAEVTGQPVEIKIGDKTWTVNKLSYRVIFRFEDWLRRKVIEAAMAVAESPVGEDEDGRPLYRPEHNKRIILSEAFRAAGRVSFGSDDAVGLTRSMEGTARLVWESLRVHHKKLTLDEVADEFAAEDLLKIMSEAFRISGMLPQEELDKLTGEEAPADAGPKSDEVPDGTAADQPGGGEGAES